MPKSIRELVRNTQGRLYVFLRNEGICEQFLRDCEDEGISFCDGAAPTSRHRSEIYAVNKDYTIQYVGFCGHVAFGCGDRIGDQDLVRVDYEEYQSD